jgi:YfiH family protein
LPATPHFIELGWIQPDWPAPASVLALSTTRSGGCSLSPYDSFNLGHHVGDADDSVAGNRALLAEALPAGCSVPWLTQVHGVGVVEAGEGLPCPEADAVWSSRSGVACPILTADCLPVLFCSTSGVVVAAAHAGWRGLLAGVLESTVAAMGVDRSQLLAWLGPAIGPGAFEVGSEVRAAFLDAAQPGQQDLLAGCFIANPQGADHYFGDLYALARIRLAAIGVTNIYGGGLCTFSDPARFFSYRRDGQTGRMASLILLR